MYSPSKEAILAVFGYKNVGISDQNGIVLVIIRLAVLNVFLLGKLKKYNKWSKNTSLESHYLSV